METNELVEQIVTNKKYLTFKEAAERAAKIQVECSDYSVVDATTHNIHYDADTNTLKFLHGNNECMSAHLTPYSMGQLCSRLQVPIRYVQRCIKEGNPYLAADNINSWLDDYHKDLFIRCHKNYVRGILTNKYSVIDAPDVVGIFKDEMKGYVVRGLVVNPERLHLRVTQKDTINVAGEDLFAGVTLDSSDVGRSTLNVVYFIYKQVCTNGLCVSEKIGEIFSQRHVGISATEFQNELRENVKRIPEITNQIIDVINFANRDGKDRRKAVDYRKMGEEDQGHFRSRIKALTRLSDDDIIQIADLMYEKYKVNPWGFVNAITEHAQNYNLERRLELERMAWNLLDSRVFY